MGKWFQRPEIQQQPPAVPAAWLVEYGESVEIHASRSEVWALIKPVENSVLLDPAVVKAFNAPGTPTGIGEIQCFISRRDGKDQISAIEVLDEVPEVRAVTRTLGDTDDMRRISYFLTDSPSGTVLRQEHRLTILGSEVQHAQVLEQHVRRFSRDYLARVKQVAESDWARA